MTYYGIKKPSIEDSTSITQYCNKKGISTENIYTVDFSDYDSTLALIGKSYPDIRIYNRDGFLIPYANAKTCNAAAFSLMDSLNLSHSYDLDSSIVFEDLTRTLRNLNGDISIPEMDGNSDFYTFIFWTKWTGRLNKTHVIPWEIKSRLNPNAKITVFKVNLDIQQYWNFPDKNAKINFEKTFKIKFENSN